MLRDHILNTVALLLTAAASVTTQASNLSQASGGITLSKTRVIYPGNARSGITYTLTNNTPRPYLLQSWVLPYSSSASEGNDEDKAKKPPFIVLPPLTRFEPYATLTLSIRLTQNSLPQERESVFVLALNAIPSLADENAQQTSIAMSTQNNLKLFYRPDGLPPMDETKLAEQLEFRRKGNLLTVKNTAPFYVTFSSLSVGNTVIDQKNTRMVPPFSEQTWPLPPSASGELRWQLITDQGRPGKAISRPTG
ncbi:fimbria/pilus periplasmic chaperone [Enterobacteriaceae bacterium RIT693]|nr:fimbria/pilus periplasmic chaperone [Enterobacteriaceae bacterium RIT693]